MSSREAYSPKVQQLAVRLVAESESSHGSRGAAISAVAKDVGCSAQTLRKWLKQAEERTRKSSGKRRAPAKRKAPRVHTTAAKRVWAKAPRIAPVPRPDPALGHTWADSMRDFFGIFEGPEAREKGSKFKAIMTLAHHPPLATAWLNYNVFLSTELSLRPRLCEIAILRVAWRLGSMYEWTQHQVIGEGMGLGKQHFEAIQEGPEATLWWEVERLVLQLVDELLTDAQVTDETWVGLTEHFDHKQLLELLFLVGTYGMLAWVFNALRVEPEDMSAQERREVIFSPDNVYGKARA